MHRIESVTAELLHDQPQVNVIVRIRDSDGLEGVGEAWWGIYDAKHPSRTGSPIIAVVNDMLAPRLVGRDADGIERLWFEIMDWGYRYADQGIFLMGLSGVDLALWDLKGKRLGAGVATLLGGPVSDGIPGYASFPRYRNAERLGAETERAIEAGFTAIKLHEVNLELIAGLCDEYADDVEIMVDVNGHFDPLEAIAFGSLLHELGVTWFEEPVRPMRDHDAIRRVGASIGCDLAAGENEYSLEDFDRLLATGALAYVQPEITKIGGLTAARRISTLAELHNVALCPHNFRLGPSLYASIQWAFTSPASRWVEMPWVPAGQAFSFPAPLPPMRDGLVLPLEGPGLGCG